VVTPRKRPRQQRSRETVAAIEEAAAQLFDRYGHAATTTNKIAERAGVSIGTLYRYFPNKDALLWSLAEQHLDATAAAVTEALARAARQELPLPLLLHDIVHRVADLHTRRPALHRLLFDQAPRTPDLVARFRQTEQALAAALAAHLRRLGIAGSDPEAAALLAVQGVQAQIHGVVLDPPGGRDRDDLLAAIVTQWHRALTHHH
jgi:Transcriptional regulator